MRLPWILVPFLLALGACTDVDQVDSRVRSRTVGVEGGQVELRVTEMLPQEGHRRFLIGARNVWPLDMAAPAELAARRRAAVEAEMAQLCPAGQEIDGHAESLAEGLTWLRCARS